MIQQEIDKGAQVIDVDNLDERELDTLEDDISSQPEFVEPPMKESVTGEAETIAFQADTKPILDIMSKALYTEREVFLRELISNASDALEKARYLQSTNQSIVSPERPFEIRIFANRDKRTITLIDSGIGMDAEEMKNHLGIIARSGSKAFVQQLKRNAEQPEAGNAGGDSPAQNIIGQFGVGFYSSFMVADRVEVYSRSAKSDDISESGPGWYWSSDGSGSYQLAPAANCERGTKIILHLKPDDDTAGDSGNITKFADSFTLKSIVRKYSNFVGFPVFLNDERVETTGGQ